ncbi:DUF5696 domain-containing protein [Cohnella abietis]|uniref:Uncharacterized protein n=1 Tax=Cohnella abietis TaxID=2507935 RepID=A0A3T1D0R8_9BACL|nr:DUF5696 domain-containing protein [Cohnella abietis]BBI31703.1 hypothetical protein KCTCHS21_11020 [Cohnella abietis]
MSICILVVLLFIFFTRGGETSLVHALEEAGIAEPVSMHTPLYVGEPWKPGAGSDGFALALENKNYSLYVRPDNTQIALLDKRSGHRWTSNPTKEQLAGETVKGLPLANLQSPFALTYVTTTGKDQTTEKVVNALDPKLEIAMIKNDKGLQISYSFTEKKLGLAIQYELTDKGLKVRVPTDGIKEEGDFVVFSLDLLPYFGAAAAGEDGYIFVPDGPGGLIKFDSKRADLSKGYIHQVYGLDVTNMLNWFRSGERREDIAFPVFGVKRGANAFVAIITRGGDSSNIAAMPPGMKSTFYNVYTSQIYRENYLYQRSRIPPTPIKAVQKERLKTDREIEYRFLSSQDTDYVGMANAYRDYLIETGGLGSPLKPVEHVPLYLKIMGGGFRAAYNQIEYVPTTTFAQATEIVQGLQKKGVANMEVVYYGWQRMGGNKIDKRFPIEAKLGGNSAAKAFVSELRKSDIGVQFYDQLIWLDDSSTSLSPRNSGVRKMDGTVFKDETWFLSKPARTVDLAYQSIQELKKIGVSGMFYDGLGSMVFNDYDPTGLTTREDAIKIYKGLLDYTRRELGTSGVYRGNDYSLNNVDYIDDLPNDSSYDFMIDETVPFYPIVLHGYVSYSFGDGGNLRNDVQTEFLKSIEYGAMPTFFLTYDESRKLMDLNIWFYLFSSQYEKWADRIGKEYGQFDSLAKVFAQKIVGHKKLADKRFETTYEDGTRVIVDYNKGTFDVEGGGGA